MGLENVKDALLVGFAGLTCVAAVAAVPAIHQRSISDPGPENVPGVRFLDPEIDREMDCLRRRFRMVEAGMFPGVLYTDEIGERNCPGFYEDVESDDLIGQRTDLLEEAGVRKDIEQWYSRAGRPIDVRVNLDALKEAREDGKVSFETIRSYRSY